MLQPFLNKFSKWDDNFILRKLLTCSSKVSVAYVNITGALKGSKLSSCHIKMVNGHLLASLRSASILKCDF